MLRKPVLLSALVACVALARAADAAYVDVQFRPLDGPLDTATEWALEMISDVPIGSAGIYIWGADPYTTSFIRDPWIPLPLPPYPGIRATIDAIEDPTAPWGIFNATWFGLPPGMIINAGPGFLSDRLGPPDTWLFLGILWPVSQTDIQAGEGMETGLWADHLGNPIPASDVHYTFPEPRALLLLALGIVALAARVRILRA